MVAQRSKPTSNPAGYRSGSAWVTGTHATVLAVGPTGSDVSVDGGRSWTAFDAGSFDSVECTNDGACWASVSRAGRDPDPLNLSHLRVEVIRGHR